MIGLVLTLALLLLGYVVGRYRDQQHRARLDHEEAQLRAQVLVSQLPRLPAGADPRLVLGEVVIATDYFRQAAMALRGLVGGEVKSYATLLDRARREALVRAMRNAVASGADQLVNVRFETSTVAAGGVEVLCFGTAIRTQPIR